MRGEEDKRARRHSWTKKNDGDRYRIGKHVDEKSREEQNKDNKMEEANENQRQKGHRKAKLESGKKNEFRQKKMNTRKESERHGESMNECM